MSFRPQSRPQQSQAPIKLTKPVCQIHHSLSTLTVPRYSPPLLTHALCVLPIRCSVKKVRELEPESKGHNLHVKVVELRTVLEKTKFDGSKITIGEVTTDHRTRSLSCSLTPHSYCTHSAQRANMLGYLMRCTVTQALVGDKTGSVLLTVRNGQSPIALHASVTLTTRQLECASLTDGHRLSLGVRMCTEQIAVCQPGQSITIRNAKIEMYKGHMRLVVDIWGVIEPSEKQLDEQPDTSNNLSSIEYELVDA